MNHISVLIVDDDLNKISSVIASIRESNQEIISYTQASSVQEAIETLQKKEFHLLISDLKLPLKPDDVILDILVMLTPRTGHTDPSRILVKKIRQ